MKSNALRHGSLFSGIGGFDLAAEWMGWENIFHCEVDPFCREVLKYYFPKAKSYGDIRETEFSSYKGRIDILTGGFPCQPFSTAGKRKGKEDERHLWPDMLRAIHQIQPRWVVGENVRGIISWNEGLVFEEVCVDLEIEGYRVWPYVLPAAGVGAPHRRERVWFVAYRNGNGPQFTPEFKENYHRRFQKRLEKGHESDPLYGNRHAAHPSVKRLQKRSPQCIRQNKTEKRVRLDDRTERSGNFRNVAHTYSSERCQRRLHPAGSKASERYPRSRHTWPGGNTWEDFPTESPLCTGDDGFPGRLDNITFSKWRRESIKAAGNAIVPQVALRLFKVIAEMEYINRHYENRA